MSETASLDEVDWRQVFEATMWLLTERDTEQSRAQTWLTGKEIAGVTDIEEDEVLVALSALGEAGLLHVRTAMTEGDVDVLLVTYPAGAASPDEPGVEAPIPRLGRARREIGDAIGTG